jgi:tetratricopeptide (TPR) repeat protein/uncharacterized caspase-like protein
MRFTVLLAATCILLPATVPAVNQTEPTPKAWALIIGVSRYPKLPGGRQLQFAERDAALLAAALSDSGFDKSNIRVLVSTQATLQAVRSAVGNWLARSTSPTDDVFIFFSGHGMVESEFGEAYLLCHDSDPQDLYATALSVSDLKQAFLDRVKARQVLFIVDAMRRDFFDPETHPTAAQSLTSAFDRLASSRPGLSAILANGPGQFSREGQRWGGYGVFSKLLADGVSGKADRDSNGSMSAEELFEFLSARVPQETSNRQNPWRTRSQPTQLALALKSPSGSTAPQPRPTESLSTRSPAVKPSSENRTVESTPAQPPIPTSRSGSRVTESPASRETAASATSVTPRAEPRPTRETSSTASSGRGSVPSPKLATAPVGPPVTPGNPPAATASATAGVSGAVENAPAPARAADRPPNLDPITSQPTINRETPVESLTVSRAGSVPSPLLLQLEASIAAGNLIEPKENSAWDTYQRLKSERDQHSELPRIESLLSEALVNASREITLGDLRADNIGTRIDDFRRAGQMLSRARGLRPADPLIPLLEKLSAAQALVGLQFYEEGEKALLAIQSSRLAAVENTLGLTHLGALDEWRAERAFKRAIELDPNWATPHYNLAVVLKSRQKDEALAEFERAAALAPSNWSVQAALGDEYFARENWTRSAETYRKALSVNPDESVLHTKLGHALYSLGRRDEAEREYQKARELSGRQK